MPGLALEGLVDCSVNPSAWVQGGYRERLR